MALIVTCYYPCLRFSAVTAGWGTSRRAAAAAPDPCNRPGQLSAGPAAPAHPQAPVTAAGCCALPHMTACRRQMYGSHLLYNILALLDGSARNTTCIQSAILHGKQPSVACFQTNMHMLDRALQDTFTTAYYNPSDLYQPMHGQTYLLLHPVGPLQGASPKVLQTGSEQTGNCSRMRRKSSGD
eukprot:GHRQ01037908.1.p1 GENE.GHRQ01037908.1~~GHRQ01037908.1.p1  ORF type:complete len:183 (-),score=14.27 GHRQ01037908.1:29-577(-)